MYAQHTQQMYSGVLGDSITTCWANSRPDRHFEEQITFKRAITLPNG